MAVSRSTYRTYVRASAPVSYTHLDVYKRQIGSKRPMVLSECVEESCSPISGKMITWNLSNKIR